MGHVDYFVDRYCQLFDATSRAWLPFQLWPPQWQTLCAFDEERLHVVLKARQLGLSWLCVAYALWLMRFAPGSVILLFSRRDDEATELLDRLRGMHARLPAWLRLPVSTDNAHEFKLTNGSRALSFTTTRHSARSFTASLVIIDEADFIRWFKQLLAAARPTVDAGGRLIVVSTVDKETQGSAFKRLFQQAEQKLNNYHATFLPWHARPERDESWYQAQRRDYDEDDLQQEYPATSAQALAPRSAQKRFRVQWLDQVYEEMQALRLSWLSATPATIYRAPEAGRRYLVAADPAEGSPTSDPSAATLFDVETWEEVASLHGRFETDVFAGYLVALADEYGGALICPERNNHGHALIDNIKFLGYERLLYLNPGDGKYGWLSNLKSKIQAVDHAAAVLRDGACCLHSRATINELALFDAATLKAPPGFHDDLAM
ncbi:MAG: terminase large subunit domain-containing protein, partial [Ardenticatenaceae bacterium]